MVQAWGQIDDLDTTMGITQYETNGLRIQTPRIFQAMDASELRRVANACHDLLNNRYRGNYPSEAINPDTLAASMAQGTTMMFTLETKDEIVAMASIMHRPNKLDGGVRTAELCRVAKSTASAAANVSVRYLSKYRLHWAITEGNLPGIDFLSCMVRVASAGKDGVASGGRAQSVWWGGRRHGVKLPLIPTYVGWGVRIGDIEPQVAFVVPTDTAKWIHAVRQQRLFVPNVMVQHVIHTLFIEATEGQAAPYITVVPETHDTRQIIFREAEPPSTYLAAQYYITDQPTRLACRPLDEVNRQLYASISQKLVIESSVMASPDGAQIVRRLMAAHGWSLAGWQPSEVSYGGICLVLARVNPLYQDQLILPALHYNYFNDGLDGTRWVLEGMYQAMYGQVLGYQGCTLCS